MDHPIDKSLRSKDGLLFFSAHNPKVGGSNPPPATKFFSFNHFRNRTQPNLYASANIRERCV
jgi:hypothetical protein